MPRICLVTPGHLSTNPRLVKEADALVEAGHEVAIVAADYTPWAREADREFATRPWRVSKTLHFGPHADLPSRVLQALRRRGGRALAKLGIRHPAVIRAAWHPIAPELVSAAKSILADLYVAHYPAALPAAALAAREHGSRYAFDAEDFHLGDPSDGPEYVLERQMIRAIEGRYLPGCAYVTAASPGIAAAYARAYGIPLPSVILNVFPLDQAPPAPTRRGTIKPNPSIYWFSQTIGPHRGLECAVRAMGISQSRPHLFLRGTPAAGFIERLGKLATAAGVADRLHVLAPAAPSEMARLASCFDVGFVGEPGHTANNQIALSNKQFTYFLAGIPAVMSDTPAHRSAAHEAGAAVLLFPIEDPQGLASRLDALLCNPAALASARAMAWQIGQQRFNWNIEKAVLLDCVTSALVRH
jgi:glycosyltransferase involved in cell wall biosynthesis